MSNQFNYIHDDIIALQMLKADDFVPYKVSIKCGSFDFLHTVPTEIGHTLSITVHPPKLDVDVSLEPQIGGGWSLEL